MKQMCKGWVRFGSCVVAAMLALGAVSARAATIYVATNSLADGPGTAWTNAFHTIQGAVNVATNGDTVLVTNGIYNSNGSVTPGASLQNRVCITRAMTVRSVNGPSNTVIVGDTGVRCVYLTANVVLSGFTLTNGHTLAQGPSYYLDRAGGGLFMDGGGTVSNCTVSGCTAETLGGGACIFIASGVAMNNCIFIGNSSAGSGGGIATLESAPILRNCLLVRNSAGSGGGAFYSGGNGTLHNCTIYSNSAAGTGGGTYFDHGGSMENCIVVGNTPDSLGGSGPSVSYSCGTGFGGTGSITNDPLFVNGPEGDFHLSAASPCINAGNNESWMSGATDLDGGTRIIATTVDMGVYEYPAAGITITNGSAGVVYTVTKYTIGGTYNQYLVGTLWWTNSASAVGGSFAAAGPWQVSDIPLAIGANVIQVFGTNTAGSVASDSVTITRSMPTVMYVATNGANVAPYTNWTDAATTIQAAVDIVAIGGTVWVSNGVYAVGGAPNGSPAMSNRVAITKAITVQSVNGAAVTSIQGAPDPFTGGLGTNATRCVYMTAGVLSGFTLTNGYTRTDADWNTQQGGGGALLRGGVISNCVVTACVSSHFAGGLDLFGGDAWNCIIVGNSSYDGGGLALQGSEAFNCLVRNNRASNRGGGVFFWQSGTLGNCTVAGNTAATNAGGVYCYQGGTNLNSIIYSNTVGGAVGNWTTNAGGVFAYSCTTPNPGGSGNITNNPLFMNALADDFHLQTNSPCIDKGANAYASGDRDLDGNPRIAGSAVDLGAYEYSPPAITITNTVTTVPFEQTTIVIGGTNNAAVVGTMFWTNAATGASGSFPAQPAWNTPPISLLSQNQITVRGSNSLGAIASAVITITRQGPPVAYVALGGSNVWPFDSWTNAATSIQVAVDAVAVSGTVWVTNGVYNAGSTVTPGGVEPNRVSITKDILVQSINGPSNTFVVGVGPIGTSAMRCAYLTAGTLSGFTLTNGFTRSGNWDKDEEGGGAYLNGGGTVSNCIVTGCSSYDCGGGIYVNNGGSVNNCTITRNSSRSVSTDGGLGGGGVTLTSGGTLNGCVISGNTASKSANGGGSGGGVECEFGGTVNNCIISNNTASADGGGGGVHLAAGGRLNNSTICYNTTGGGGGGVQFELNGGAANNCLVYANTAGGEGGGAYLNSGGVMNNCTLAGNTSTLNQADGGGAYLLGGGTLNNCIVSGNTQDGTRDIAVSGAGTTVRYTCSPGLSGSGNLTDAPLFMDAPANNYRLLAGSPCINAGTNAYAQGATDLDGNPRIIGGVVDMGAYECTSGSTTNGITWSWLLQYGLATDGSADHLHSDTDTFDNGQEYIADTDPTNAASFFAITAISNRPSSCVVFFPSSSNRQYTMHWSSNLVSGVWTKVSGAGPRIGAGGLDSMQDTNGPSKAMFYRLKVELP